MRIVTFALAAGLLASPTASLAAEDAGARISTAFQELGMQSEQSTCYGQTITGSLDPPAREEAAMIVETSQNADEVRENVKAGGLEMVQAFLNAQTECGS